MDIRVSSPFPSWAWPAVWEWSKSFRDRIADDFAPCTSADFVEAMLARRDRTWAVYRAGELGGLISYQPWNKVTGASHCLFKRAFWGTATTLPALRLVAEQLFREGVLAINSVVFEDNHAIQSLLRKLGARPLRDALKATTMRGGKPIDSRIFQLLREDFQNAASGDYRGISGRQRLSRRVEQPEQKGDERAELYAESNGASGELVSVASGPHQQPGEPRPAEDVGAVECEPVV